MREALVEEGLFPPVKPASEFVHALVAGLAEEIGAECPSRQAIRTQGMWIT